jgi:hypothetical protein
MLHVQYQACNLIARESSNAPTYSLDLSKIGKSWNFSQCFAQKLSFVSKELPLVEPETALGESAFKLQHATRHAASVMV